MHAQTAQFLEAEAQADPRWLATRLADTRREVLAARAWAWQVSAERDTLRAEVDRLRDELTQRSPLATFEPYPDEPMVALGWPDAFPAVQLAPVADASEADAHDSWDVTWEDVVAEAAAVPVAAPAVAVVPSGGRARRRKPGRRR